MNEPNTTSKVTPPASRSSSESSSSREPAASADPNGLFTIIGSLPDAILLISDDRGLEFANPEFCRLYGITAPIESLFGRSSAEIARLTSSSYTEPEVQFQRILEIVARRVLVRDEEVQLKDGRTFQRSFVPVDIPGRKYSRIWHYRDITMRKQHEQSLRASESRFRALFENHAAIGLIIDQDSGAILEANKAAVDFYGWPLATLRQMRIQDINPSSADELQRCIQAISNGQQTRFEFRHCLADGSKRDVAVYVNRIDYGGRPVLYSIVHDITNRKLAETALARQRALLNTICDVAKIGGWEFNPYTQEITWTDQTFKLHDLVPGQVPSSEEATNYVHVDDRPRLANALEKTVREGVGYDLDIRLITARGRTVWVRAVGQPQLIDGHVATLTGTVQDISERKEHERIQVEMETQWWQQQKSDSLNRMSAAVAHVFNNKLQAVILGLDLELSRTEGKATGSSTLKQALVAAREAADVSATLLTFLGHGSEPAEALDLSHLCQTSAEFLKTALKLATPIKTSLQGPGPHIVGNVNLLRQALLHLVTNADEAYSGKGGLICLTTGSVPGEAIPATSRFPVDFKPKASRYAFFEISDVGCGISAENLARVFDPFFTTKFVGKGLGMSVVLGIARHHQGCVRIESAPSCGTTVRVYLPQSADQKAGT